MTTEKLTPVHPGEILLEDFIRPLGISQYRLCKDISVQPRRINQIVHGERSITAEAPFSLSHSFGPRTGSGWTYRASTTLRRRKTDWETDWFLRSMNSLLPRRRSSRQRWILHRAGFFGATPPVTPRVARALIALVGREFLVERDSSSLLSSE